MSWAGLQQAAREEKIKKEDKFMEWIFAMASEKEVINVALKMQSICSKDPNLVIKAIRETVSSIELSVRAGDMDVNDATNAAFEGIVGLCFFAENTRNGLQQMVDEAVERDASEKELSLRVDVANRFALLDTSTQIPTFGEALVRALASKGMINSEVLAYAAKNDYTILGKEMSADYESMKNAMNEYRISLQQYKQQVRHQLKGALTDQTGASRSLEFSAAAEAGPTGMSVEPKVRYEWKEGVGRRKLASALIAQNLQDRLDLQDEPKDPVKIDDDKRRNEAYLGQTARVHVYSFQQKTLEEYIHHPDTHGHGGTYTIVKFAKGVESSSLPIGNRLVSWLFTGEHGTLMSLGRADTEEEQRSHRKGVPHDSGMWTKVKRRIKSGKSIIGERATEDIPLLSDQLTRMGIGQGCGPLIKHGTKDIQNTPDQDKWCKAPKVAALAALSMWRDAGSAKAVRWLSVPPHVAFTGERIDAVGHVMSVSSSDDIGQGNKSDSKVLVMCSNSLQDELEDQTLWG